MRRVGAIAARSRSANRSIAAGRRPARQADMAAARALAPRIRISIEAQDAPDRRIRVRRGRSPGSFLDDLDLRGGQDLLAVLLLDGAGRLDLLDGRADVLVEVVGRLVLRQVVRDLLAVF